MTRISKATAVKDVSELVKFRCIKQINGSSSRNIRYELSLDKKLKDIPIIYVKRNYIDKSTNDIINTQSEFIESLTHDSIIIQIQSLKNKKQKTLLEQILSIFDNKKVHTISIDENNYPKKYHSIIKRLIKATANEIILQTMDIEDEILEELEIRERRYYTLKEEKEKALLKQQEILKEKLEALHKLKKAEEKAKKIEEEKIKAEEKAKELEEKAKNQKIEIAKNLLKNNVNIDIIITSTGLNKKEIEMLEIS